MPCDTIKKPGQTLSQRTADVKKALVKFNAGLASGAIRARIGPQGGVAFDGISQTDRDGVTDACAYRQIMVTGSALAKSAIAKAEALAGRAVDRSVVATGLHSHDGGKTWHPSHKPHR